ncbi:MAG: ferritin-like domain-containing protein, partial [Gammaproteobacteria bacterium]|nr:ferritin-like domain-containing protein [Gammaproteobacteria bacterium]
MKNKYSIIDIAKHILDCSDPSEKVRLTHFYVRQWNDGLLTRDTDIGVDKLPSPGRPEKPELVPPSKVAKRPMNTDEGRQALVHAICHIEFNAIIAWDAVYRFRDMPEQYVTDWLKVADEEAYHFSLLRERLNEMGC